MDCRILKPYLEIKTQPKSKIKFKTENHYNKSAQIAWNNYNQIEFVCELKNFNFNLPNIELYVCVQSVVFNQLNISHPFKLKCSNSDVRIKSNLLLRKYELNLENSFLFDLDKETLLCNIKDLFVECLNDQELEEYFESFYVKENFKNMPKDIELIKSELVKSKTNIDLNKFKLKLQVIMHDLNKNKLENYLTEPIYTELIENDSYSHSCLSILNKNDLRILRCSRTYGSVYGGDEMIIQCTYIDPNDIQVEFFQFKNDNEIGWRRLVVLNPTEIHGNCSLVLKTPEYFSKDKNGHIIEKKYHRIKVYFRLFRPSTKQFSDKWIYFYSHNNFKELEDLFGPNILNDSRLFKIFNFDKTENDLDDEECIQILDDVLNKTQELEKPKKKLKTILDNNTNEKFVQVNLDFNDRLNETSNKRSLEQTELALRNSLENCLTRMNNVANRNGKSLLHFAKTRSFHELIKTQRYLLNNQDENGNTVIHLSILYGNFDLFEIFIDIILTIPSQNFLNIKNSKQLTPLLMACHLGELEVCEYLLEANSDLTQCDLYGCNSIHIACKNNNLNLLKILIKYVHRNRVFNVLNCFNHDGYAPLHLAVLSESFSLVQELIYNQNIKINIPDRKTGYTALHHAVQKSSLLNICNILVKNESIDLNSRSFNGTTPLHIAVSNKNYLITCLLVSNGANLNIQSDVPVFFDTESFDLCSKSNSLMRRCVETILNHKRNVFEQNKKQALDSNDSKDKNNDLEVNDYTKISVEIEKIYENELNKKAYSQVCGVKSISYKNNYDAFYYAQNDEWMLEIFKNSKSIKRNFLEKIMCFEEFRKYYEKKQFVRMNSSNVNSFVKNVQNKLNSINKNQQNSVKVSEQETLLAENLSNQ